MRIRKKLLVLHTGFFVTLAVILLVSLRPAVSAIVASSELAEAFAVLRGVAAQAEAGVVSPVFPELDNLSVATGTAESLGIGRALADAATAQPWVPLRARELRDAAEAVIYLPSTDAGPGRLYTAIVSIPEARERVTQLYFLLTIALLSVYALIAAALEIVVLPRLVYAPIERALAADQAVREGRASDEIIPDSLIPADELGEIMRSRNESVVALRSHQAALADALARLESVANDLKRKNHLLESARRNLADADRLASLGMMSAGIAHELNTPLAVLKGLVEQLGKNPSAGVDPARAELMLRVVKRLERLGESLLDFARVRPPQTSRVRLSTLAEEAITLVRLDRDTGPIDIVDRTPGDLELLCDADRIVQVFVNLLRNAVDAIVTARRAKGTIFDAGNPDSPAEGPRIEVSAERSVREGREWVSVSVSDNGPGIDPQILPRLFEPFASTRLDSKGTGLGLAVADGIVREHGGLILARNRHDVTGAIFEIMLPLSPPERAGGAQIPDTDDSTSLADTRPPELRDA
jgi:signal transduction histidine kinase